MRYSGLRISINKNIEDENKRIGISLKMLEYLDDHYADLIYGCDFNTNEVILDVFKVIRYYYYRNEKDKMFSVIDELKSVVGCNNIIFIDDSSGLVIENEKQLLSDKLTFRGGELFLDLTDSDIDVRFEKFSQMISVHKITLDEFSKVGCVLFSEILVHTTLNDKNRKITMVDNVFHGLFRCNPGLEKALLYTVTATTR